jgi:glycosyltransferase involved in cell wall biosynthesis
MSVLQTVMNDYPGRVGLQQRVLPAYRVPFFDALAATCKNGLSVFAGKPVVAEFVETTGQLRTAQHTPARNRHFLTPSSSFYSCWQEGFVPWLEAWQPDALIVEANPRYVSTRPALSWMQRRRKPVIGWGLGITPARGKGWKNLLNAWRLRSWRRFLRHFDALICYSKSGAEQYCALGFPADRVVVAPNAVAPRPTTLPIERPATLSGPPHVLFVGRLQARKRIDLLLNACAALPSVEQPVLTIVGDGPDRAAMEAHAQVVYPRAQFVGARSGDALESYFTTADLFVLPGTGGLAIQQAMAHALPVIVAEGDGTQSNLVRSGSGWLVPPSNEQALQTTLKDALSDIPRLRRMGTEAYRIVADEVNLEAMVSAFLRALHAVSRR